ncbi:hypothetical protein ABZ639_06720 [Saccharomonospora sp. NPDC006951]
MSTAIRTPASSVSPRPRRRAGRARELGTLAGTTPGVLTLLIIGLVLAAVVAGLGTALSVQRRAQALDELATSSGPLSAAAQQIYRSLSSADATATSAFLSGGREPSELRESYLTDIAAAQSALAVAVAAREPADVTAPDSPLATLSGQISVYTGLVDTARAVNQQGLPLGAAYQREASYLMRSQLLPAAEALYRAETGNVGAGQDRASGFPFLELAFGVLALAALVAAQLYLRRRTRRVFNLGLLAATLAALVSLVWVLVASTAASADVGRSRDNGSTQSDVLARARIAALTARADETLTLVARGSGDDFEKHYQDTSGHLGGAEGGLLAEARALATTSEVREHVDEAIAQRRNWSAAHEDIRQADSGGDYRAAVDITIGSGEAATSFAAVDSALAAAIDNTTASFDDEIGQARNALTGAVAAVVVLAVIMAASAVLGLWQRLKEYR